jgi:hypothetical protein
VLTMPIETAARGD